VTPSDAPGSRLRIGLGVGPVAICALVTIRLLGVAWVSAWRQVDAPGRASPDEVLALVAASLAASVAAWLLGGVVLELAAHVPGRCGRAADRWSRRVTPALAQRAAGFVLGIGVGVVGGPAQAVATGAPTTASVSAAHAAGERAPNPGFRAATTPATAPAEAASTAAEPVAPGFTPAPPRVRPQADPGLLGARVAHRDADEVVVHRGDSLWSIAARHLGPDASAAEIDRSWRQWFSLNRDRVGADPDLILPGQILRVPGPDQSASAVR